MCYGFARFAFGLFLPQIDTDLALTPTLSGFISGGSFLGYCVAIILSAYLTERIGARAVAIGAALVATVGMAGIAMAPSHYTRLRGHAGRLKYGVSLSAHGGSGGRRRPP